MARLARPSEMGSMGRANITGSIGIAKTRKDSIVIIYSASLLFLYIFLPVYLSRLNHLPFKAQWAFYSINLLFALYYFKMSRSRIYQLKLKIEDLQEKINIINDQRSHELKNKIALQEKIARYSSLKKIIEELNLSLDLESIADHLISIAFLLIANNKGTCLLYLLDKDAHLSLRLFKSRKENKSLIIKTKEGDIFDLWVLRHLAPLLIEDIRKDFRFDLEKLKAEDSRPISSLVSAPLLSEHRFLGVLRLDYPDPGFYSQEDLRFLVTVCDLAAVALENGEFYKKTQDLAVHDELTSLYTKGYFLERIREECKRSLRQNRAFSLLMLDIDYFKNYNDKFGHTAGDIVLKTIAKIMTEAVRDIDHIISRFGGEEFCVGIVGMDKKKVYDFACELLVRVEKAKIILRQQETSVTVSIGVAAFPKDAKDEDELILKADKAMYEAKQKGRNRVISV